MLIRTKFSKENKLNEARSETEIPEERCISPEKRQQTIDELRLI